MKRTFPLILALCCLVFATSCKDDPDSAENVNLTVDKTTLTFRSAYQHQMVYVSSNAAWNVSVDCGSTPKWLYTMNTAYTAGEHQLYVVALAYEPEQYNSRTATITITSGKATKVITVTQTSDVVLLSSVHSIEASNKGTTFPVLLKRNISYVLTNTAPDWIHQNATRTVLSDSLSFTVDANTTEQARTGRLIFYNAEHNVSDTITVRQNETEVFRLIGSLAEGGHIFAAYHTADTASVYIQGNQTYKVSWKATSWIRKTSKKPSTRAIATDSLYFAITANSTELDRKDTIWFIPTDTLLKSLKTFVVIQQPKKPEE